MKSLRGHEKDGTGPFSGMRHRICNSELPCLHTALEHGQMIQIERNKVLVGELVEALKDAIEFTEKATSVEGSEIVYRKIGNTLTKANGYLDD